MRGEEYLKFGKQGKGTLELPGAREYRLKQFGRAARPYSLLP